MARFSEELIEEIRSSNDIVDVISQYVILKRSGRNFFGLCPFHNEKSPSFSVSPDKQIFHCFGCGVGRKCIYIFNKNRRYKLCRSSPNVSRKVKYTITNLRK